MLISFAAKASISHVIALVFFHSSSYSVVVILMGGYVSEYVVLIFMVSILQVSAGFVIGLGISFIFTSSIVVANRPPRHHWIGGLSLNSSLMLYLFTLVA
jgi:hypothetical protein